MFFNFFSAVSRHLKVSSGVDAGFEGCVVTLPNLDDLNLKKRQNKHIMK